MKDVSKLMVRSELTLKEALRLLNETAMSVLFVTDGRGVLLRTVTDGDIRRLLLAGCSLSSRLNCLEDKPPIVVREGVSIEEVVALMDAHGVNQVPVLDSEGRPIDIHLRREIQSRILLSTPHMGEYERQFVEAAFDSNWVAPVGPNVDAFEREVADYVGSAYAVAVNSGTAAIHLALRLLEVGPGDVVLCSSFTFVASANPILYQHGIPVFIDSEPGTWNMSPVALEKALECYCSRGQKPRAIVVAHLYGQSAGMKAIMALSKKYGVPVVEDAAESMGGLYQGQHTGTFGTFGVFSFNGNKIITTSGGGMLVSDDESLIEKARFLSTQAKDDAPYYEHSVVGYNYRMSNVLAGIGRGQLKVLDSRVKSRRAIFERYRSALADIDGLVWMPEPDGDYTNRWLSVVRLQNPIDVKPRQLIEKLHKKDIELRHVWKPMHQQPLYDGCDYFTHQDDQSFCDGLFDEALCLPSASNMTVDEQMRVIDAIREML